MAIVQAPFQNEIQSTNTNPLSTLGPINSGAYSPYSGVSSDNLFTDANANSFLTNFNDASVLYSPGQTQDEQRYNDLVAAYQYLSNPQNQATEDATNGAGFSQYMLGQLQSDIGEEQNLVTLAGDQSNYNTLSQNQAAINSALNTISSSASAQQITQAVQSISGMGYGTSQLASAVNELQSYVNSQGIAGSLGDQLLKELVTYWANGTPIGQSVNYPQNVKNAINTVIQGLPTNQLAQLATDVNNANSALQPAENNAIQDFTLNTPDYGAAENQLENYYNNPTTGQVALSTQAANEDLYQTAYQLKNQLNTQAASAGVSNSGERQEAISNVNAQAANTAAQTYQQTANEAQQAIDQYNQSVQQQESQQQALENQVKSGDINSLFDTTTQNNISTYNADEGAQNQTALNTAQQGITANQQQNSLTNELAEGAGTAAGTVAGVATGGLI